MSSFASKVVDENPRNIAKPFNGVSAAAGTRRPLGDMSNAQAGAAPKAAIKPVITGSLRIPPIGPSAAAPRPAETASHAPETTAMPLMPRASVSSAASTASSSSIAAVSSISFGFDREASDVEACFRDLSIAEVNAADMADPKRVGDYANAIMRYHLDKETTKCPKGTSMAAQTDVNEKFRAILVDWLVEVHLKFKLSPETLFLAVSIMDRFLEKKIISRTTLQLVGITSILLASKYEEIYAPAVRDLVFVSARAYTREEILRMEATMLNTLRFNLTTPTAFVFLQRYLRLVEADAKLTNLAYFYVERTLQEYSMLRQLPSVVAAAGFFLALKALAPSSRTPVWTPTIQHFTGHTESSMRECVTEMHTILAGSVSSQLQAVRKKYANVKFLEVTKIALPTL